MTVIAPALKVWRIVLATEDVVDVSTGQTYPGVQHVAFVVAPERSLIGPVVFADQTLRHLDAVPRIMEQIPTDKPLWPWKIGRPSDLESIYGVCPAMDPAEVLGLVRRQFADREAVLDMLDMGLLRVAPRPIDVTRPGVW